MKHNMKTFKDMNRLMTILSLLLAGLFSTSCDLVDLGELLGDGFGEIIDNESNNDVIQDEEHSGLSDEARYLSRLYEESGGDSWVHNTNWCTDSPVGEWYGIETDSEGRVVSIDLSGNNLTGTFILELSEFRSLSSISVDDNSLEAFELHGESEEFKNLCLSSCVSDRISFDYVEKVFISGCDSLTEISGRCTDLEVVDTYFRHDAHTPFRVEPENVVIRNSHMHSCGVSSDNLRFEESTTYDTWYCNTRVRMELVNCYCSTICGGDFNEDTVIYMENATLWQSNWDSESLVTFNCTITGDQWDSLFRNKE